MWVLLSLLLLAPVLSLGKLHRSSDSHRVWPLGTRHGSQTVPRSDVAEHTPSLEHREGLAGGTL